MTRKDRHPRTEMKLPDVRRYEIAPEGDFDKAIESVLRDIKAAHDLCLPFKVETEHSKQFRYGGNVEKADVFTYVVTIGLMSERLKSPQENIP